MGGRGGAFQAFSGPKKDCRSFRRSNSRQIYVQRLDIDSTISVKKNRMWRLDICLSTITANVPVVHE